MTNTSFCALDSDGYQKSEAGKQEYTPAAQND